MRVNWRWFGLIGLLLLPGKSSAEMRTFTDDSGRTVQAELVGTRGENIVLKRNGKLAQWPISKLSKADQAYVTSWQKNPPRSPKINIRVWEKDGLGPKGELNPQRLDQNAPGKNIPMLRQTQEKGYYKHYDIYLNNRAQVDASDLVVSYILYVINVQNLVIAEDATETVSTINAESKHTLTTKGITYVRAKTTSTTIGATPLGHLSVGSNTNRKKEKFGGAWVRVYSASGELLGEQKQLLQSIEKLNPQWTGATQKTQIPIPSSFSKLEEIFGPLKKVIEKLPPPPANLPKPPAGKGGPKLPF